MGTFERLERPGAANHFSGSFTRGFMTTTNALIQAQRILHSAFPGGDIEVNADGSFNIDDPRSIIDARRLEWESLGNEQLAAHMNALELDIVRRAGDAQDEFTFAFLLRRKVIEADLQLVCALQGVALASISPKPAHKDHILLVVVDEGVSIVDIRLALTLPSVS